MKLIKIVPVYIELKAERLCPEVAYNAVCNASPAKSGKNTYLLESSEGGEKVARYSFIGFNPAAKLTVKENITGSNDGDSNSNIGNSKCKCGVNLANLRIFNPALANLKIRGENSLEIMRNLMKQFRLTKVQLSRFFGGFVGYFSYDMIREFIDLDDNKANDIVEPLCEFVLAENNIIFDHRENKTYLLSHRFLNDGDEIDRKGVLGDLNRIAENIYRYSRDNPDENSKDNSVDNSKNNSINNKIETDKIKKKFTSNISKKEFEENVRAARNYIHAGDIFQVVLSQRLETEFRGDKFGIYRRLKEINPSPYMYYLDFGDRKIVGSSPEMLVRVEKKTVTTYPIAGTRPRGKTREEDDMLANEMLSDKKERAEHVMLVDLGRNDVGRVAKFGTVRVKKFMGVEKYSHVQHMVSEVVGELKDNMDEFDALKSIFPAGTVSGAPKVRAMEIIDELEPVRRGIYAGCVGYFSFNGNMDTAITIRTIVFEKDMAYVQVGAGIVADSVPENEYFETMNKGKGMLKALGI